MKQTRDDGTCWTCAKPRCLGAFGHTLGRLRFAVRAARHARPTSVAGRLRLLWHDFMLHGLLNRGTERCQDCGGDYPLWFAEDAEWRRVLGAPSGLLCPTCFIRRGGAVAYGGRCPLRENDLAAEGHG